MGTIIAVSNQKGGVGKTTTAINLSAGLALKGKKTLLIDLDPQGNATSGLGIDKNDSKSGTYELLIGGVSATECVVHTELDNLFLIPSGTALSGATVEIVSLAHRETRLKSAIAGIKFAYDYIIIDCPPSLDLLTVNAFTASDKLLVPIQCEFYALEGLGQLVNTVKLIKQRLNPALDIDGVVCTMFDNRTNLSAQVVEEVKKYFSKRVIPVCIPRNVRLAEAPSYGKPIQLYDKHCPGAVCYELLTDEIIKRNEGNK